MTDQNPARVLRAEEVAALLRISRDAVYKGASDGTIPGVLHLGRSLRFSRVVLERWLETGATP